MRKLRNLFIKRTFNARSESYNKDIKSIQKEALKNPISLSNIDSQNEIIEHENNIQQQEYSVQEIHANETSTEENESNTESIQEIQEHISKEVEISENVDTDSNIENTNNVIDTSNEVNTSESTTQNNNDTSNVVDTDNTTQTSNESHTDNTAQTNTNNRATDTSNTNITNHVESNTLDTNQSMQAERKRSKKIINEILVPQKPQKIKDKKEKSGKKEKRNFSFASFKESVIAGLNNALGFVESLLIKEPLVYALSYENNIACKLDESMLVTKDGNLCCALKLEGISYAGTTQTQELELAQIRANFFNKLDPSIELTILCKKELLDLNLHENTIKNQYAESIIKKWEKSFKAYKISYYLIFATKTKRVTGFFESKKRALTEEKVEEHNKAHSYKDKVAKLKDSIESARKILSEFQPKILSSNYLLNIYATYSNMQETKLTYTHELITDCYMTSDVEFKKDYMIFHTNTGQEVYARFLSVKAYESESISSIIPTGILRENADYYFFFSCEAIKKQEAINKVKRVRTFAVDIVQNSLDILTQELQSDRENIIKISLSILLLSKESVADLNEKTNSMKALLENQNLSMVRETINQKPLFFSFYPSRSNLNARKRHQTSAVLSTLCTFENDILGNTKNRFGKVPVTIFQHLSGSPFLFNFHDNDSSSSVGHTLVIGGTGYGKTTIMQFLIANLFKYDIHIFAMDKLRGMNVFTEYVGGEYHDLEKGKFALNPFSLTDTEENNMFLRIWLSEMGLITEEEHEIKDIVSSTIRQLRNTEKSKIEKGEDYTFAFSDFFHSLILPNDSKDIKVRFNEYLDGLFDNKECALNFKNQLSMLNMDAIIKSPKLSALSAMYIFHKLKNIAKNDNKGFFIWIDELRDYLNDESMRDKIIEMIVEIRKLNGVITMGLQNLDFLDEIKNSNTFIDNMSNYIVFPTKDEKTLEKLQSKLSLSDTELNFLKSASKESRQILYKQKEVGSAILKVNLERLGEYLRVFSSSSNDVLELKALKEQHPNEWRDMYLKGMKPILEKKEIV